MIRRNILYKKISLFGKILIFPFQEKFFFDASKLQVYCEQVSTNSAEQKFLHGGVLNFSFQKNTLVYLLQPMQERENNVNNSGDIHIILC